MLPKMLSGVVNPSPLNALAIADRALRTSVADARGVLRLSLGDVERAIYPRSVLKPIQAVPFIESGAADAFAVSVRSSRAKTTRRRRYIIRIQTDISSVYRRTTTRRRMPPSVRLRTAPLDDRTISRRGVFQ